jgi:hypothetical protein
MATLMVMDTATVKDQMKDTDMDTATVTVTLL